MTTALPITPAVELAHALVDSVLGTAGIRTLALKGPVLAQQGLRARRFSSDADVLVDPAKHQAAVELLGKYGWRLRFERDVPQIVELHSLTLVHQQWPCDIDVHWYFPGFHAPPQVSFDALWQRRVQLELGGRLVFASDLVGSAAVAMVHCLRSPADPRRKAELDAVCARMQTEPHRVRVELRELAIQTRSATLLAPMLSWLGVGDVPDDLTAQERQRWYRYTRARELGSTGAWMLALSSGSLTQRLRVLRRALYLEAWEIDELFAHEGPMTPWRRWRIRLQRLRRGLASLVPTIRAFRDG